MQRLVFTFLFLIIFFYSDLCLAPSKRCKQEYDALSNLNLNAQLDVSNYNEVSVRDVWDYASQTGIPFLDAVISLNKGDRVFDSGAGHAVALMQMIRKKGVRGVAANTQDFISAISLLRNPTDSDFVLTSNRYALVERFGHLTGKTFQRIAEGLGYEFSRSVFPEHKLSKRYVTQAKDAVEGILSVIKTLRDQGRFEYAVDFSENVLHKKIASGERFKLIMDIYGAYFYSANRLLQIENYYNALEKGGIAIVVLGVEYDNLIPKDFVEIASRRQALVEYLTATYPDIFEYIPPRDISYELEPSLSSYKTNTERGQKCMTRPILVIKKSSSVDALNLGMKADASEMNYLQGKKVRLPQNIIYKP